MDPMQLHIIYRQRVEQALKGGSLDEPEYREALLVFLTDLLRRVDDLTEQITTLEVALERAAQAAIEATRRDVPPKI